MNDRLHRRPTARLPAENTLLHCLLFIILEHHRQRQEDERRHDAKDPVSPAPAILSIDRVRSQRSRKGRADERRLHKSKSERSVPETRSIGHKHIQNQVQAVVPDPIQRVARRVPAGSIARGQHHHAKQVHRDGDDGALCTTPQIQRLTQREFHNPAYDIGQNVRRRDLGCALEFTLNIVDQDTADRRMERQHECANPDPVPVRSKFQSQ